jgi:hypothetical protein
MKAFINNTYVGPSDSMETFSFCGKIKSRIVWRYPHVLSVEKPGEERKTTVVVHVQYLLWRDDGNCCKGSVAKEPDAGSGRRIVVQR